MRAKSFVLLVVALGCGVVASVAVSQVVLDQRKGETPTVGILVASKEISAASKIAVDAFRIEQWPADRVPPGAIVDPKLIENKFTKQRIYAGEPFFEGKLSTKGKEFSVPPGYRIFDIPVRDESGGGGYIGPGDRVDVFGYFEKSPRVAAAKSVKVMENLEVVMVDGVAVVDPESNAKKKSSTIQLLVKDSQYIVLDTAANLGKMRLALRPPEQIASGTPPKQDEGEDFMAWLKNSEAAQNPKAVVSEPAHIVTQELPAVAKKESFEMTIMSATKTTRFKMSDGRMTVAKDDEAAETPTPPLGGYQSQSYPSYTPTYKAPVQPGNTQSNTSSNSSNRSSASNAVASGTSLAGNGSEPANSVQPNMTWDPASGSWQTGGFKATYPGSK